MPKQNEWLDCFEAAKVVGVTPQTIRRKARLGLLQHRRVGRNPVRCRMFFRRADIDKLRAEYSIDGPLATTTGE